MKRTLFLMVFLSAFFAVCGTKSQTTVWVVRHAEKDTSDAKNADPALSAQGRQRAKDLSVYLSGKSIAAIYSTPYKRTFQTADPLAKANNLTVQAYDPRDPNALVTELLANYRGKSTLVVGHSNTVPGIVSMFGAKFQPAALTDNDYDYLFKVTISNEGKATVESFQFGAANRSQ